MIKKVYFCFLLLMIVSVLSVSSVAKSLDVSGSIVKNTSSVRNGLNFSFDVVNADDFDHDNVIVCINGSDFDLLGKNNTLSLGTIKAGKTVHVEADALVKYTSDKIGFFDKIILFFKHLFTSTVSATGTVSNNNCVVSSVNKNIVIGGYSANVTINIYYTGFDEQNIQEMNVVESTLSSGVGAKDGLEQLLSGGLIKNYFDLGNGNFSFVYKNGLRGSYVNEFADKDTNVIPLSEQYNGATSYALLDNHPEYSYADILILYSFNYDIDNQSFRRPFYNNTDDKQSCINQWGTKQVNTTFDDEVTVSDLKNIDTEYDLICFSGHGAKDQNGYMMCLTEEATDIKKNVYAADLDAGRIGVIILNDKEYFCVYPGLFSHSYTNNEMNNDIIFMQCCMGFGDGDNVDYSFAKAFASAGAEYTVGFHNEVDSVYGRKFMKTFVDDILTGKSVGTAYLNTVSLYGENDGYGAYPVKYGNDEFMFTDISYETITVNMIDDEDKDAGSKQIYVKPGQTISREYIQDISYDMWGYIIRTTENVSEHKAVAKSKNSYGALLLNSGA